MTLPVRIEAKAWTDSRYATVALYLGLPAGDAEIALIRCAAIWRWQTEHYTEAAPTYVVPEGVVIGALKSLDGPRALVAAGLAEPVDGGLRIKGGRNDKGESRIDWYHRDSLQRSAAGKASAARRTSAGTFGSTPAKADGHPTADQRTGNEPATADQRRTDSPDSDLRTPDPEISLSAGAREAGTPDCPELVPGDAGAPNARRGTDSIVMLVAEAAEILNAERLALDPTGHRVDETTAGELVRRLTATPVDDRRRRLMHAVACVVAKARRTREVGLLRWSTFASERAWSFVQDSKVAEYAASDGTRPGHGTRDPTPRQQVQQRRTPIRDLTAPKRSDP